MQMIDFRTAGLEDVLDAFASSDPLPGGGSAAALTGALGASLLLMVAGMTKTRTGTPEETSDLAAAAARLRLIRDELSVLVADDSQAYLGVIHAHRLPRSSDEERMRRRDAIQSAVQAATDVPLRTMRACERALRDAPAVARFGNPNAVADAAVGSTLLVAALEGAALNVDVNLPGVADQDYRTRAEEERRVLLSSARHLARQTLEHTTGG
jgi:formiminotetrahydrofolate cyclodeaminase